MREINCNTCGDTVILPDRGEQITETSSANETKLEHFERTGHGPSQPTEPPEWYQEGDF